MISIFNLNIWNYNEPWQRRRELIARAIQEANPDLIALQEVTYLSGYTEDTRHQADQLLARLRGYGLIWQPAVKRRSRGGEGIGLMPGCICTPPSQSIPLPSGSPSSVLTICSCHGQSWLAKSPSLLTSRIRMAFTHPITAACGPGWIGSEVGINRECHCEERSVRRSNLLAAREEIASLHSQ